MSVPPPSSNRTSGITASGLPEISWHEQGMHIGTSRRRQPLQIELLQKGVPGLVGGAAKATLAATTQVTHQPRLNEVVDRAKAFRRIAVAEVLRPAAKIAIDLANQRGHRLPAPLRSGHGSHAIPQTSQRF